MQTNLVARAARLAAASLILVSAVVSCGDSNQLSEVEKRKAERLAYQAQIEAHPFHHTNHPTPQEVDGMPKYDRPDLARQHDFMMTMDPATGTVPRERLADVYKIVDEYIDDPSKYAPGDVTLPWEERGPDNVAGRVRAMMFDPDGSYAVWAGGVGGGLWYNPDITPVGAGTWTKVDDFWANIAVTSIAYDPTDTDVMYVGTGEGFFNADAIVGDGIWKTTDGGSTWAQLASTTGFNYVTKVVVNPNGWVLAGTHQGVQRSTDGGTTWSTVLNISDPNSGTSRCADLEIGADGMIYASMGIFSEGDVFRSTTGLAGSWTHLSPGGNGFPTTGVNRIELAPAPSNANVLYAITQSSSTLSAEGIYRSTDQGSNWTSVTIPNDADGGIAPGFTRGQAWYDLIAKVDPTDEDHVYIGGIDIFHTFDGGTTWNQVTHWYGGFGEPYVHADQHAIEFHSVDETDVIFGNDGGIAFTGSGSSVQPSFFIRNDDFNITQYYACAVHPTAATDYYLAGSQDNGTQQYQSPGMNSTTEPIGGDGAFCHIDQTDPTYQLGSYVYNNHYRSTNSGASFPGLSFENTGRFINPSDYDNSLGILYAARTGSDLRRISGIRGTPVVANVTIPSLGGTASAITVSPHTTATTTLYVGTGSGQLLRVTDADGGAPASTDMDPGSALPNAYISCIEIGADEDEILVTFSNYGVTSVWYTNDAGATWLSKEGNLPDMPVRWALFNPDDLTEVLLATEVGCWSTSNILAGSPTWVPSNTGLANVRVDMLQLRTSDNQVAAATHGRGLFTGNFFTPLTTNDAGIVSVSSPSGGYCNDLVSLTVQLQNFGSATLTSCDIVWDIDGGGSTTYNWTGSLTGGNSEIVNLGSASPGAGVHTFNVSTQLPNGVADEDVANDAASEAFTIFDTTVDVCITTDRYGNETTWAIFDGPTQVASGGPYAFQGSSGAYPQPAETVCLLSTVCYDIFVYDSFGDGMCCAYGNGFWEVKDSQGNQIAFGDGIFGVSQTANFCPPAPPAITTYYSVASGAMSDPIWSTSPGGSGGPGVFDCSTNHVIQNGTVVTNTASGFSSRDFTVEAGGTFDIGTGGDNHAICGNLDVDGTYITSDGEISFLGSFQQNFGGDTNTEWFDIFVNNTGGVQLLSDQTVTGGLDVRSDFDVNGNVFTFGSNSLATGRLDYVAPGASFIGDAVCEIYAAGGTQGWRMIGQSVSGTIADWDDDIPTTGFPGSQWPFWGFTNILDYDETLINPAHYDSGFVAPSALTDAINPGTGRFAYYNGPVTFDVTGPPNTGAINNSPSWTDSSTDPFNDGWFLAANSYQGTMDWDAASGWTRTNVTGIIYAWDNDLQQWATYSLGGSGVNGGSRFLAPQQAFWIKATALGAIFNYDMQVLFPVHVDYIRETETFIPSTLKLHLSGNDWTDETALVVREGATSEVDSNYDALKLKSANPEVPSLYTVLQNGEFDQPTAINAVGQFEAGMIIPLYLEAPADGDYIISTDDYDPAQFGTCLVIEDLLTGTLTTLEPGMNFTVNAGPEDAPHRFNIVVQGSVTVETNGSSCANEATGIATASVSVSETATVNWYDEFDQLIESMTGVSGDVTVEDLFAGDYSVEIIDDNLACGILTRDFSIDLVEQPELEVVESHLPTCNAVNDGSVSIALDEGSWDVEIIKNGDAYDSFEFEGDLLEINGLGAGEYEVIVSNICGNEHIFILMDDHAALEASFEGPQIIDLAETSTAEYVNTSTGLIDIHAWDIDGFTILSEQIGTYYFSEPGEYVFTLTVSNGECYDTFDLDITVVDTSVDVDDPSENIADSWNVWQQGDQLNFAVPGEWFAQKVNVQIHAANGQLVMDEQMVLSPTNILNVNQLSPGVYHLTVFGNGVDKTTKKVYIK